MTTAPLVTVPGLRRSRVSTPTLLKRGRTGILISTAVLLVTTMIATFIHRAAMQTVGKDSAPSIIAAQHIKAAMADMDADAADELLMPVAGSVTVDKAYEARHLEASQALLVAAENITFGASEREPILAMDLGLGTYGRMMQRALDLRASDNAGAIVAYDDAAEELDKELLPAASRLDDANNAELEKAYLRRSQRSFWGRGAVLLMAAVTLMALVMMQGFLSRRTRRSFNPLLVLATLVTFGWTVVAMSAMFTEQQQLHIAKEDAFQSIHGLWRARAVAFEANAEQGRALLDERTAPVRAQQDERAMSLKSGLLASLPAGVSAEELNATLRTGEHLPKGFSGYLNDELNNITFAGEREAAVDSLEAWERYETVERRVQQLDHQGQHQQAVDLFMGQSATALKQFDDSLKGTLEINQREFDSSVAEGLGAVGYGLDGVSVVAALLASLLVFLGIQQRIREYE